MSRKRYERIFCGQHEKDRLNGYVYDFSVDYDSTAVVDILGIHKYLMKKNEIV